MSNPTASSSDDSIPEREESDLTPESWPAPEFSTVAIAAIRGVFILTDDAYIHEEYDRSLATADMVAVKDWRGPSPDYDPFGEGQEAIPCYEAQAPGGGLAIPESAVRTILTTDTLAEAAESKEGDGR
jgi:hypothetical protein